MVAGTLLIGGTILLLGGVILLEDGVLPADSVWVAGTVWQAVSKSSSKTTANKADKKRYFFMESQPFSKIRQKYYLYLQYTTHFLSCNYKTITV